MGIPVLYAALNKKTAMSEVRPWIGAYVSVAALEILRPLRAIDCTGMAHEHAEYGFLTLPLDRDATEEEAAKAVWIDIDAAFAEPVTRSDDVAEYAPTQILAELFRSEGYDGVVYKSHFEGETGYNVALFDLDCVKVVTIHLYKVTTAKFCFDKEYP